MARLFSQNLPFQNNDNLPNTYIYQRRLKKLPNSKSTHKMAKAVEDLAQNGEMLPNLVTLKAIVGI